MRFQKISIFLPWKIIKNSEGGGKLLKVELFKEKYMSEGKLEFPEGGGGKFQKPSLGGWYGYFLEQI